MSNTLDDFIQDISDFDTVPILPIKTLKRCHILLPENSRPVGAVFHHNCYYSYVMAYTVDAAAQRGASRLTEKGHKALLTRAPRGLILWVAEPDAQRVWSS